MMGIVFALYGTDVAGGTRAVFEVANRLSDRGYNVRIVALGAIIHGTILRCRCTILKHRYLYVLLSL
jgi:hypothetical protein